MDSEAEQKAVDEAIARGDREWVGDIWAPRAAESSSGDFFDNEGVYKKRFDREWGEQVELFGGAVGGEAEGGGDKSEIAELQAVMWDCDDMMAVIFDYYASLNSDGRISAMTFNEWGMFVEDFSLSESGSASGCTRADLDRVFIAVDTKAGAIAKAAAQAKVKAGHKAISDVRQGKALKRTEWSSALVQLAIMKFVRTGVVNSVAEGLQKLLVEWIDPQINYDLLPDPNLFRRSCYIKTVSTELAAHADSLKQLHTALCELEFGAYAKRLGAKTWVSALRALGFMGIDLSERECNLCFVWSRMAVSRTSSALDDRLPFEGFLEALCRLASIKALPDDLELIEKGCADAGAYVVMMNKDDESRREYEQMLLDKRIGWGGTPGQPLDRCVAHTLWIIVRSIEDVCHKGSGGADERNSELSAKEVATWIKRMGV